MTSSSASSARARLIEAALARFAADGALVPTLDEIRRDAKVSVGSLYHHFPDKRALATALYLDGLAGYQAAVLALLDDEPDARRGVEGLVRLHLRWSAGHRDLARFLLEQRGAVDEQAVLAASRPFLKDVFRWYRQHAHYGAVRELPFDVAHALWLGPSQEYLRHRLSGRARSVDHRAAATLAHAAWQSLKEPT